MQLGRWGSSSRTIFRLIWWVEKVPKSSTVVSMFQVRRLSKRFVCDTTWLRTRSKIWLWSRISALRLSSTARVAMEWLKIKHLTADHSLLVSTEAWPHLNRSRVSDSLSGNQMKRLMSIKDLKLLRVSRHRRLQVSSESNWRVRLQLLRWVRTWKENSPQDWLDKSWSKKSW